MCELDILHDSLYQFCPELHLKRLNSLTLACHALLDCKTLTLTELGRNLPTKARTKHNIKRIDRLLGNRHLHKERLAVYRWHASFICSGNTMPIVLVDWSDIREQKRLMVFRVCFEYWVKDRPGTSYNGSCGGGEYQSLRPKISRYHIRQSFDPTMNQFSSFSFSCYTSESSPFEPLGYSLNVLYSRSVSFCNPIFSDWFSLGYSTFKITYLERDFRLFYSRAVPEYQWWAVDFRCVAAVSSVPKIVDWMDNFKLVGLLNNYRYASLTSNFFGRLSTFQDGCLIRMRYRLARRVSQNYSTTISGTTKLIVQPNARKYESLFQPCSWRSDCVSL
uniref:Gastric cancer-related protein GCYS-20 n=1 Tax=Homo sapiens TaxID=9606 RepID=Q9UH48_HUMAN|nr:gastric cancer-related protein GCYS-20 [Homo sapiens]